MIIRKLFKFENAHIVRGCSSNRCKYSLHGHSYKVEVLLEASRLDKGQMVYDFGLFKTTIKEFIDSFDHATAFWDEDDEEYITSVKKHSQRWVSLPLSPSAEQFSRIIFFLVDRILTHTIMQNGEIGVNVNSVIVHETDTGYAQCFKEDVLNVNMGAIEMERIVFSPQVTMEWNDAFMWEKLKRGELFINTPPS